MTSKEIREAFLAFFKSKGHQIVPSAPVVVKNDPTLMFTNAGMNQFKELFLGEAQAKYPRVADTQRCLRVSGKHNDLEEVGIDTYHHTLFEMLGNWSFGDYFKKEAIAWAWELLTEVYKLDKDRLYVTIFEGDASERLDRDMEAYDFWKALIAEDRILLGNKKDNFWEMGETGPCGPCSEIHFDMRSDEERAQVKGQELVNADHPQVIEIWNLVFMQFNRLKNGSLESLPAKHVDTGMGFERLVRCIQGKTSNYDTDVFQPIIQFIAERSGIAYGTDEKTDIAMRVLSDHIRAVSFAIADGQLPSNNKAGYVIRRILRRAVRYAYTFLDFKSPFINELVPLLAAQFEGVFDELIQQVSFVQKVVLEEEVSFLRTLTTGIQRFENYAAEHTSVDGEFAFELFDTYGFPIDLTELLSREKGLQVDMEGFNIALQQQKERSRAATAIDTGDWVVVQDDDESTFVGYDYLEATTQILKYRKVSAKGKDQYQLVLSVTPFYAEGGGQVGDSGLLISEANEKVHIIDTKKENGLIVHFVNQLPPVLTGDFQAIVDKTKRVDTENNHSATHLLHAALKQVLGDHVNQKGSLVSPNILRFDVSHFAKISYEEIKQIEDIVNQKIRENISLKEERMVPYQQAIDSGVTALFGEKYGDYVRVITFEDAFSKELCGGTHVRSTGQIGFFKIISESAVAAGVRRIEAITGTQAYAVIREQFELVDKMRELMNNPKDFVASVGKLIEDNSELRKEIENAIKERSLALKSDLETKFEVINGVNFLAMQVDLPNADAVKTLAYALKGAMDNVFIVLGADFDGKPSLTVTISDDLAKEKGWNAGTIVKDLAKDIQGGGGGQPFFATAGGKLSAGLSKAIARAKDFLN
ncbi:alanine--tRNA ligase [Sphingobacterium psychroaquaticum]|uniref:Alanine--tRNA ligase n=1 Tax=Sphingobacterium psychroaquaticum TaxID=561061 RepID=A0A1X7IZJ0_9SPHI|nr:alanine--tRNA ligase [Sphingobacterium psychroaquaticum]QBQ40275.1 alanine--tRNA ligase [Sphingobacterium psychroaquaticum]SMG20331.1 alanyl-tRNA synthetase [Sphingobacterium psychroaquaticum]